MLRCVSVRFRALTHSQSPRCCDSLAQRLRNRARMGRAGMDATRQTPLAAQGGRRKLSRARREQRRSRRARLSRRLGRRTWRGCSCPTTSARPTSASSMGSGERGRLAVCERVRTCRRLPFPEAGRTAAASSRGAGNTRARRPRPGRAQRHRRERDLGSGSTVMVLLRRAARRCVHT